MRMEFENLDYDVSPYTGLTRDSWIEAGKYLLEGIFQNITNIEDPIVFTRNETQITYPHIDASAKKQEAERMAERFEGLARSLFIAAPLIRDNPMLKINGINILEYYKKHIISCCDKHNALYVDDFDFLKASYSE